MLLRFYKGTGHTFLNKFKANHVIKFGKMLVQTFGIALLFLRFNQNVNDSFRIYGITLEAEK